MHYFSSTYSEARKKFCDIAQSHDWEVESHVNPICLGPEGEDLAMDTVWIGSKDAKNVKIITSGVHGTEGYAGSAIQLNLMELGSFDNLPDDTAVLLVHAINPYGFAYNSRTNENNVDLNRNHIDWSKDLPEEHPLTEKLCNILDMNKWEESFFMPNTLNWQPLSFLFMFAKNGTRTMQDALTRGQYRFKDSLVYGGEDPEWSNQQWRGILKKYLVNAKTVEHIDIHTGLGASGDVEVIFIDTPSSSSRSSRYARVKKIWGDKVTCPGTINSESSVGTGAMNNAIEEEVEKGVVVTTVTLEIGTLKPAEVFKGMAMDNWVRSKKLPATDPMYKKAKNLAKRAFFLENDDVWKEKVLEHGRQTVEQMGLAPSRVTKPTINLNNVKNKKR